MDIAIKNILFNFRKTIHPYNILYKAGLVFTLNSDIISNLHN